MMFLALLFLALVHVRTSSPPSNNCRISLHPGCTCADHANNTVNVFCNKIHLATIPPLDFGRHHVHTLSFQGNQISTIETGDFFGIKIERLLLGNNTFSHLDMLSFWGLEHLQVLDLSHNNFERVPSDGLRLLRNLRILQLEGNKIHLVEAGAFVNLGQLEVLSLDENPLEKIEEGGLRGTRLQLLTLNGVKLGEHQGLRALPTGHLRTLKSLTLSHCGLNEVPDGWFNALPQLRSLNLEHNKLLTLPNLTLPLLSTLQLSHNHLTTFPLLVKLPYLQALSISHNRIKQLPQNVFNQSKALLTLDLSHNSLKDLSLKAFKGAESLWRLNLRHNSLITLDERVLEWRALREVHLHHNPWLCNCIIQWMKRAYRKQDPMSEIIVDLRELTCARPHYLIGTLIRRVAIREFTCDHDYYYYYDDYEE